MTMVPTFIIALAVVILLGLAVMALVIKRCVIVVMPNELVVLVGRSYQVEGRTLPYRIVTSGRAIRVPLIERAIRIPRGPFRGELEVDDVLCLDGARVRLQGPWEARITRDPAGQVNAVERFLGLPSGTIARVAQEVLEGGLRAGLAEVDSEKIVFDPDALQDVCLRATTEDFDAQGLELVTCGLTASISQPAPERGGQVRAPDQLMLDRLADPDLSARAKQAAVELMGTAQFTITVGVQRTDPPRLGELPDAYRGGLSVYGLAPNGLEVEVVFPASRSAEVELMEGGGLDLPLVVQALRWDGPHQSLVTLAV